MCPWRDKVPFGPCLTAPEEIGYRGFLTIERKAIEDRAGDIGRAAQPLRDFYQER